MKSVGIILAGGKGTRFKSESENKTAARLKGKPLVVYAVELLSGVVDETMVVVGAFAESVKAAIGIRPEIIYAVQSEPLGTGHALVTGVNDLISRGDRPDVVVVGYADHMMFYKQQIVKDMLALIEKTKAQVVLVTAEFDDPDSLRWGRIIRNDQGEVTRIVEQKDASDEERRVTEVNPGFYCFDFSFLERNKDKLEKSPVSGEYYITDFIQIAVDQGLKVVPLMLPFADVGIGVNTREELETDEEFKRQS